MRITSDKIQVAFGESSLGLVLVAQSHKGVCAVLLGEERRALRRNLQERFPGATLVDGDAKFTALVAKVVEFVESPQGDLVVPLDLRGTDFQRKVWEVLREIPAGSKVSYSDVARRIGLPKAARAVAQACAANALAVIVPCHRVVKSDGKLSGYRWGVARKNLLLKKECEFFASRQLRLLS